MRMSVRRLVLVIGSGGSFDKARMALSPGTPSCRFSGNDSGYDVTGVGNAARVIAGASGEWCRGALDPVGAEWLMNM